jgi:hypothetical protein
MGLDLETVRLEVEKQVGTGPDQKQVGNIPYTPRVKKVLNLASKEAKQLQHTYVGTEHILLGLLREGDGVAARVLKNLDVDIEDARKEILKELDPNFVMGEEELEDEDEGEEAGSIKGGDKKGTKTPALRAFGRDLTEIARKGEMDPVIGRADEIERVIQILCRRTKNNPVLLGEAGVGKTGLFLVRRHRICITRSISSARPITGSISPLRAISVKSRPKARRAGVLVPFLSPPLIDPASSPSSSSSNSSSPITKLGSNSLSISLRASSISTSRFFRTRAATPSPSRNNPKRICSVPT